MAQAGQEFPGVSVAVEAKRTLAPAFLHGSPPRTVYLTGPPAARYPSRRTGPGQGPTPGRRLIPLMRSPAPNNPSGPQGSEAVERTLADPFPLTICAVGWCAWACTGGGQRSRATAWAWALARRRRTRPRTSEESADAGRRARGTPGAQARGPDGTLGAPNRPVEHRQGPLRGPGRP